MSQWDKKKIYEKYLIYKSIHKFSPIFDTIFFRIEFSSKLSENIMMHFVDFLILKVASISRREGIQNEIYIYKLSYEYINISKYIINLCIDTKYTFSSDLIQIAFTMTSFS